MNIKISDYPQLFLIAWNRDRNGFMDEQDAFHLYESHWRFVDIEDLSLFEKDFIVRLTNTYGEGVFHA